MSEKKQHIKQHAHDTNCNCVPSDRQEWSKEWGLEKQTQGLDKCNIGRQNKIVENIKAEAKSKNK